MIQFSAIIDGVNAKKDRTLSVKLGTQEMSSEDSSHILDLMTKQIFVALAEAPVREQDLDIPEALTEFRSDKTPSQRLRNVLYKYWEKEKKGSIDWDTYYKREMEKIIEYIKDKLD